MSQNYKKKGAYILTPAALAFSLNASSCSGVLCGFICLLNLSCGNGNNLLGFIIWLFFEQFTLCNIVAKYLSLSHSRF